MLTIEVTHSRDQAPSRHPLEAPIAIGRAPHNQIVIAAESIAPEHAQIFREGTHYIFQDLAGITHPSRLPRGSEQLLDRKSTRLNSSHSS